MLLKPAKNGPIYWQVFIRTRSQLLYAVGTGIVAVCLVLFAAVPQFQEALALQQELEGEKPKLMVLQQKLASLEGIRFSPEFTQVDQVNAALPSRKPLLELLVSLNLVAGRTGANIGDFKLSPGLIATDSTQLAEGARRVSAQGDTDTLEVSLRVQGTDQAIQDFIAQIEQVAPFTTITQLAIASQFNAAEAAGSQANSRRTATLSLSTFFFTKPIVVGIETQLPSISDPERIVLRSLEELEPTIIPDQREIIGGGQIDLFGVDPLLFEDL